MEIFMCWKEKKKPTTLNKVCLHSFQPVGQNKKWRGTRVNYLEWKNKHKVKLSEDDGDWWAVEKRCSWLSKRDRKKDISLFDQNYYKIYDYYINWINFLKVCLTWNLDGGRAWIAIMTLWVDTHVALIIYTDFCSGAGFWSPEGGSTGIMDGLCETTRWKLSWKMSQTQTTTGKPRR